MKSYLISLYKPLALSAIAIAAAFVTPVHASSKVLLPVACDVFRGIGIEKMLGTSLEFKGNQTFLSAPLRETKCFVRGGANDTGVMLSVKEFLTPSKLKEARDLFVAMETNSDFVSLSTPIKEFNRLPLWETKEGNLWLVGSDYQVVIVISSGKENQSLAIDIARAIASSYFDQLVHKKSAGK